MNVIRSAVILLLLVAMTIVALTHDVRLLAWDIVGLAIVVFLSTLSVIDAIERVTK